MDASRALDALAASRGPDAPLRTRYLRAIAVLAECAPYVDDQDLIEVIDEVIADADRTAGLVCVRDGTTWQVALRPPSDHDRSS